MTYDWLVLPGDFRSWESPQTLPALFIGLFEHVERFRNLKFAVKRITDIQSTVLSSSGGTSAFHLAIKLHLGPVYMGPDKFGTGPLRDLIGSVPKRSHESSPKLFQIARPFTWDRIIHQIAKVTAVFVERHLVVEDESPPKVKILRNKFRLIYAIDT